VSPVCRIAARFRVGGHAGVNRLNVGAGRHGVEVAPGTYRIVGRNRGGRIVLDVTLVAVDARAPSRSELSDARESNVCGSGSVLGPAATQGPLAFAAAVSLAERKQAATGATTVRHQRQTPAAATSTPQTAGPADAHLGGSIAAGLGSAADRAASPLVVTLLGLAVLILGLAALPRNAIPDPRMMAMVASHRLELGLAGTAALLAAVAAMLLV
jgi:hypothetical protein